MSVTHLQHLARLVDIKQLLYCMILCKWVIDWRVLDSQAFHNGRGCVLTNSIVLQTTRLANHYSR